MPSSSSTMQQYGSVYRCHGCLTAQLGNSIYKHHCPGESSPHRPMQGGHGQPGVNREGTRQPAGKQQVGTVHAVHHAGTGAQGRLDGPSMCKLCSGNSWQQKWVQHVNVRSAVCRVNCAGTAASAPRCGAVIYHTSLLPLPQTRSALRAPYLVSRATACGVDDECAAYALVL